MLPLWARATCSQHLHFSFFTGYKHREPNNAVLLSVCRHRCSDSMSGRCDVWTTLEDVIVSVPAQPVSANPTHLQVAGCHSTCPSLGGLFSSSLVQYMSAKTELFVVYPPISSLLESHLAPEQNACNHNPFPPHLMILFVKSHLSRSGLTNHQMWGKGL